MKIGTLTFHSSYNFGSNLQAYALQQHILELSKKYGEDVSYSIINLRTDVQKAMYDYEKNGNFFKRVIKKILYGKKLRKRQVNFENFINNYLNITREYKSIEDIVDENVSYDVCISGSDQIWNLSAYDFDWAYFLDGINCKRKISYSVSSGPRKADISISDQERIEKLIKDYNFVSVREEGTSDFVKQFTNKAISINMDPTILLTKEKWNEIIDNEKIINEPYILYYSLRPSILRSWYLRKISKKMNMKIIVANPSFKYDLIGGFSTKYESGPSEFLNLLKNAKLVISSSFHGTIFSIIFNVPFYSLNGANDYRISTLLKITKLEERAIMENSDIDLIKREAYNIDFSEANKIVEIERDKSDRYLVEALGIGDKNE